MPNSVAWKLTDLAGVRQNGLQVFSTFAGGGGSSMGYKLAGYTVAGANDLDPQMRWHYERNLNPKMFIQGAVKDLPAMNLPKQMFRLDVLDGSPPCSTFSMAGSREKAWGREKHFREGQAVQILDDLFFDFLDTVEAFKPKVVVAENVKGMLAGNARGYVRAIIDRLKRIGYRPQLFLVNSADCGVPQRRERVFFVASRRNLNLPALTLAPNQPWVSVGKACADLQRLTGAELEQTKPSNLDRKFWQLTAKGRNYSTASTEVNGKNAYWNSVRLNDATPAPTVTATDGLKHWSECRSLTLREYFRLGSFPDDYQAKSTNFGKYIVGMSVPPRMMQTVAHAIAEQWLGR